MNSVRFSSRFAPSRLVLGLGAVALFSLGGLQPATAQTVRDAGFETPSQGSGYFAYDYNPTGTAWTFSGDAGISANNTAFTLGTDNSPQGKQVGFIQNKGSISQAISGFSSGSYTFQFAATQRQPVFGFDLQNFQVLIDNTALYGSAGLTPGFDYTTYTTGPVTLSAGTHTLTFQGLNTANRAGGSNTAFIDAVGINKVAPVPEASSVISLGMLLALGLGGVAVARKKAVKA